MRKATDSLCIWWLDQADYEAIGDQAPTFLPDYIRSEYGSRRGRAGRARLWTAQEIVKQYGDFGVEGWPHSSPISRRLDPECGGIVLRKSDAHHLSRLPGLLTDFKLRRYAGRSS